MLNLLRTKKWLGPFVIATLILIGYWFLPISGKILLIPGRVDESLMWPKFQFVSSTDAADQSVRVIVTDIEPWTFVTLTVEGVPVQQTREAASQAGLWSWVWTFIPPEEDGYTLRFFYDCHTGCVERGRVTVGREGRSDGISRIPTKLGLVLADPQREWHGRIGWAVEITYATLAEHPYWGVDDLAARIKAHHEKGLNVLVRVDYAQQQSLPPIDDYVALSEYLAYFRRLASDDRLDGVYGYIVGNDYNAVDASSHAPDRPTTPEWYARVFNGYGEPVDHTDNVVQVLRSERPEIRVIVGPIRPWVDDQGGSRVYVKDVPWLNYMNTLVAALDAGAQVKAQAGISMIAPDGFDVQAPGQPDVSEMSGRLRAKEPEFDLVRESWDGARVGFSVYKDWREIINAYPHTQGRPIFIISTNTYDREGDIPPAQNYPAGWLTTALSVVNDEPQISALCWFLDSFPHSDQWDWFSLSEQPGRLVDAAEEFEVLLNASAP
jgi:hypothetical protein